MLKQPITYKDLAGKERTEDFYFNLTKSEVAKLDLSKADKGGLKAWIENIVAENNGEEIMEFFEKLIRMAYGERQADDRIFDKSPEKAARFMNSMAYDQLFMDLVTNPEKAATFIKAILPEV